MSPARAYTVHATPELCRIDVLLGLYDEAIAELERARHLLGAEDHEAASRHLARSRLAISGLAADVDVSYGDIPRNFLRLYEYVLHTLTTETVANVDAADEVLQTLRDGLMGIRAEASELERARAIPRIVPTQQLHATA